MYITSKKSVAKIAHEQNCRYAKLIAAHNSELFYTADEAYAAGKTACIYCAAVMKRIPLEMEDLQNICMANKIDITFDYADGTLNIASPYSEWKLASVGPKRRLRLYHKNTVNFDNGSSPYEGYHRQKVREETILKIVEYIVGHDWYKKDQEKKRRKEKKKGYRRVMSAKNGRKHVYRMSVSNRRLASREEAMYATGKMWW